MTSSSATLTNLHESESNSRPVVSLVGLSMGGMLQRYLLPLWPAVLLLTVLLFSSTALSLFLPQLVAQFVDQIAQAQAADLGKLFQIAIFYLLCGIGVQLLIAAATYVGAHVGWISTNRLRADLMQHVLALDMAEHKERTAGEMIERIDGDVTALSNFFSQFSVQVFGAFLLLIGSVIMFFVTDWRVGLAVSIFALLTLVVLNILRHLGIEHTRLEREASAQTYGYIEERINGLDDLRSLGAARQHLAGFLRVQANFVERSIASWLRRSWVWHASMLMFAIGYVAVLAASIGLYAAGSITLGTGFLLFQYMSMVENPIDQLSEQLQDLQKAAAGVQRVGELFQLQSQLPSGNRDLPAGALSLRFKEVDFAYTPHTPKVLKKVSFELPAGETLGLLGRTGSGKTTLTRLVSRLHKASAGSLLLGGVPIEQLSLASLRQHVAVVTQDVQLFQASVRQNLTLFDHHIPDSQILLALQEVGLAEWLQTLPKGLDTELPAGSLSAGQSQLLAFARVLLREPSLIVLDEPSSRLDPATEGMLTNAMNKLLYGRTAIVIAHRLETVARADRILVLGSGEILEYGPRQQLAQQADSHYVRLLKASQQNTSSSLEELEELLG